MSAILPPLRDEVAFVGLGSNLGDRLATLQRAVELLAAADRVAVEAVSSVYETVPVGGPAQPNFLNLAVRLRTRLSPWRLLSVCQEIEQALGRVRPGVGDRRGRSARGRGADDERWGPRSIDLDILLYDEREVATKRLQIPHPRIHERAFALIPLIEVAPGVPLPDGRSLPSLLAKLAPVEGVRMVGAQVSTPS